MYERGAKKNDLQVIEKWFYSDVLFLVSRLKLLVREVIKYS